jgi:hypothetical protein
MEVLRILAGGAAIVTIAMGLTCGVAGIATGIIVLGVIGTLMQALDG